MPASGGPQRLRAFGLCGIGPKRISWTSFQLSVAQTQPKPSDSVSEFQVDPTDDPTLDTIALLLKDEVRQKAEAKGQTVIPNPQQPASIPFWLAYHTGFDFDPRLCTPGQLKELYRDLLPCKPLTGYRMIAGKGSLTVELEGVKPVRWRSFLNADILGPVRVEAVVDLANCVTVGTPGGAGVLLVLPEKEHGDVCHDFCFLVEPSEPPHLWVVKSAKLSDLSNEWTSLHSESLPHCSRQQEVRVAVTVLHDMVTISTNSVASAWALNVPTSGGPQGLRAFGLCGVGPKRISWKSFQVYVAQEQPILNNTSFIFEEDPADKLDKGQGLRLEETSTVGTPTVSAGQDGLASSVIPKPQSAPFVSKTQCQSNGSSSEFEEDPEDDWELVMAKALSLQLHVTSVVNPDTPDSGLNDSKTSKTSVIPTPRTLAPLPFMLVYRTGFDVDPRLCTPEQCQRLYRDLLPREPLIGYRAFIGSGSLTLEFEGLNPIRWRSFLNADLHGPVRVETAVELDKCITFGTPSGAGVLVILPDENNVCCDFFFLVEPSKPPYLRVLKLAKPADLTNEWTSLHSEPLPHCFGQQEVLVEVTVLDDMITISTNSVLSAWALKVPATGGPKRLRAFGLCGIGPRRISWSSFHVSVVEAQTSRDESSWLEDDPENDPELATAIMLSLQDKKAR